MLHITVLTILKSYFQMNECVADLSVILKLSIIYAKHICLNLHYHISDNANLTGNQCLESKDLLFYIFT